MTRVKIERAARAVCRARDGGEQGQGSGADGHRRAVALLEPVVHDDRHGQVHEEGRRDAEDDAVKVPLPYLGGIGARPGRKPKDRRHDCKNHAGVALLQQLAREGGEHGRDEGLDRAVHGRIRLRPAELVHDGGDEDTRSVRYDARGYRVEPDAPQQDEPRPGRTMGLSGGFLFHDVLLRS